MVSRAGPGEKVRGVRRLHGRQGSRAQRGHGLLAKRPKSHAPAHDSVTHAATSEQHRTGWSQQRGLTRVPATLRRLMWRLTRGVAP